MAPPTSDKRPEERWLTPGSWPAPSRSASSCCWSKPRAAHTPGDPLHSPHPLTPNPDTLRGEADAEDHDGEDVNDWLVLGRRCRAGSVPSPRQVCERRAIPILSLVLVAALVCKPAPATAEPGESDSQLAAAEAMVKARRTGKQVEVTALASPTTRVMANPATGGFEVDVTAQISRVKVSDGWRDASANLVPVGDGSWRTEATPASIVVGGATGQLFRFSKDDASIGLSWPDRLGQPVVEGATATYANVFPGVDLVVKAQITAVGTYFVVHDAAAARNPALEKLSFKLTKQGVAGRAEKGGVEFKRSAGETVFALAEPLMWDSRGRLPAKRAAEAVDAGPESTVVAMPMTLSDETLEIRPDVELLRSPDTQFPVVIDPYVHDDPTYVVRVFSSSYSPHYNKWNEDAKVGYNGWTSPYYKSRMYYNFTLPSLAVSDVASAKFYAKQIHSPQHDCNDTSFGPSMTASVTGTASSSTTWSNQPTWKSGSVNNDYAVGSEDYCGASYVQKFDLTSAIKTAWSSNPKLGIGMKSSDEGSKNGWRHYKQVQGVTTKNLDGSVTSTWYPRIVVDYQPTPAAPANVVVSNGKLLGGTWATSNPTPTLSAKLAAPSGFPCGSALTNCLVAEWTLPSGAVVASPGVGSGNVSTLPWPPTQSPLADRVPATLKVRAKNLTNGKASAWTTVPVMYDAVPDPPTVSGVTQPGEYPLNTDIPINTSSNGDVVEFCWTATPSFSASPVCESVAGGSGQITVRQSARPETEMTYTTFHVSARDQSGMESPPTNVTLFFTSAP